MSPRLVILADDLSGAADCAMACHRAGMAAKVRLDPAGPEPNGPGEPADALAVDLDSRAAPPGRARALTLAVKALTDGKPLYRKIDSTLRGHVGLETAATLEATGPGAFALVCPAYPATHRAVIGGEVFVGGQPLAETEIWRRGGHGSPRLLDILAGAGLGSALLPLAMVRGGALGQAVEAARAGGARAVVCDAETEGDLEAIVQAGLGQPGVVWVGSGGLTIPLARALAPGLAPPSDAVARRAGPQLVAVGSASSVSREQLAVLAEDPRVQLLRVPPRTLVEGPEGPGWRVASRALVAAVGRPGKDVVAVAIDPSAPVEPAIGPALAAGLGALAGRQLARFGGLVATGGETARAILSTAGTRALGIRRELEPGVVLSEADGLPVVTKAGAFGNRLSLARAAEALRALPSSS